MQGTLWVTLRSNPSLHTVLKCQMFPKGNSGDHEIYSLSLWKHAQIQIQKIKYILALFLYLTVTQSVDDLDTQALHYASSKT